MKPIEILIAEYLFDNTQENAIKFAKENEFQSCLEKANHILQMVHLDFLQKRLLTLEQNKHNSYFKNDWRL